MISHFFMAAQYFHIKLNRMQDQQNDQQAKISSGNSVYGETEKLSRGVAEKSDLKIHALEETRKT